jgi:hypothetical protein
VVARHEYGSDPFPKQPFGCTLPAKHGSENEFGMNCRKSTWLLPVILTVIHFVLQTSLFVSAQISSDPEASMGSGIVGTCIAYPTSLAVLGLDSVMGNKGILWHSDILYAIKVDHYVDRFFGFTKQAVEYFMDFVLLVVAGTVQWGIVGVLIQSGWRRFRRQAQEDVISN